MKIPPEIIAEAGSNHNGNPQRALELIDVASWANATSVKFQFIFPEGLYVPEFVDGSHRSRNAVFDQRMREQISADDWKAIWEHAKRRNIPASASVFCERGIELLRGLGAPYVKVASTDLTNHTLVAAACQSFERVIVSTGMATLAEIDELVRFVRTDHPDTRLELMHCVSTYPCPLSDANPQRIQLLRNAFDLPVGYSDHTTGVLAAAMALVHGATFFEKHFTTDRSLPGFDHAHALDPSELRNYVASIHQAHASLQRPATALAAEEHTTKVRARRGFYAARDLRRGHILSAADLLFVRPSTAFASCDPKDLIGLPVEHDIPRYAALGLSGTARTVHSRWKEAQVFWYDEMQTKGIPIDDTTSDTEV